MSENVIAPLGDLLRANVGQYHLKRKRKVFVDKFEKIKLVLVEKSKGGKSEYAFYEPLEADFVAWLKETHKLTYHEDANAKQYFLRWN